MQKLCHWTILFLTFCVCVAGLHATPEDFPSLTLTQRQLCDLELLLNGAFSPVDQFMDRATYESVVNDMRLPDGSLWPIPIVLDVTEKNLTKIRSAQKIVLRDPEGTILAHMNISDIWQPTKLVEAEKVYGTRDEAHPGVANLLHQTGEYYIGGKLTAVTLPKHYDFPSLRKTPAQLKAYFKQRKLEKILAFQTGQLMHRAQQELTQCAAESINAHLLLQHFASVSSPDLFTRIKCSQKLLSYFPKESATLCLLPLSLREAGLRESIWHALICKNYGCTHLIVEGEHTPLKKYAKEIDIQLIPYKEMVYVKEDGIYRTIDAVPPGKTILRLSEAQLKLLLQEDKEIPEWFTYPEIAAELKKAYPPKAKQGFTLFFTGLSAAGKSTIANALSVRLMELQSRPVTLLDGDIIRIHLSSELGFSKAHRSLNVRRVGFVASEITKNGGVALCALIAPYEEDRQYNRNLISSKGNYIEIYLSTSLAECERRDPKGLYVNARQGKLKGFTGIDDPYEEPKSPTLVIDTATCTVSEAVEVILSYLQNENYF